MYLVNFLYFNFLLLKFTVLLDCRLCFEISYEPCMLIVLRTMGVHPFVSSHGLANRIWGANWICCVTNSIQANNEFPSLSKKYHECKKKSMI